VHQLCRSASAQLVELEHRAQPLRAQASTRVPASLCSLQLHTPKTTPVRTCVHTPLFGIVSVSGRNASLSLFLSFLSLPFAFPAKVVVASCSAAGLLREGEHLRQLLAPPGDPGCGHGDGPLRFTIVAVDEAGQVMCCSGVIRG
jgi:hypothetical protein